MSIFTATKNMKSRMKGDFHVRFCGKVGVKFPCLTRLKLFIYGYQNRIRSSRGLEAECKRNIELFWLMKELRPDHNTINRFRKDNAEAIRQVFRATVKTAQNLNLIGGALLAGDSTKLRAQNSKRNNYNTKKIKRHIEYIDRKLDEYTQRLAEADGDHDDPRSRAK